jgi:hypothetical protein
MLRRGPDTENRPRRRFSPDPAAPDPFPREAPAGAGGPASTALGGWTAPASYLDLDAALVAELVRASLAARGVAALRGGEVAVGAMLATLAMRGEDVLLDEILPLTGAELRLNRYAVGQLTPVAVHPVATAAVLLRALAFCAVSPPGETWEAVAHDGRVPIAIASARSQELRWLQPPAPDAPHSASWVAPTTEDAPPGSSTLWWQTELARPAASPAAGLTPAPLAPGGPPGRAAATFDDPSLRLSPPPVDGVSDQLLEAVGRTVDKALSSALLELELDPATLDELRDNSVLDRLVTAVSRLEQQVGQVDYVTRELSALTTAVDELTDSVRSLLRHQWDNMPPPNVWTRLQKADDEVRRAVDELTSEVRGRLPRPGSRGA